jgi:hypothetical protein
MVVVESPWPWLLVLLLLVGHESSGEIGELVVTKVVVWVDKLRGKYVAIATRCRCHGHGVVGKHVIVHGVFVEIACCVVDEHVGYIGLCEC